MSLLARWFGRRAEASIASEPAAAEPLPDRLHAGAAELPLAPLWRAQPAGPQLDWAALQHWVQGLPEAQQALAWTAGERAWLLHLGAALSATGPSYRLQESEHALLLSPLAAREAQLLLDFLARTRQRVLRLLGDLALESPWGKDILLVLDDEDGYYRYLAPFYGDAGGAFALSSGVFLDAGCGHFVTVRSDLRAIEPVVAHEFTHGVLRHLNLPRWLDEGLAVGVEQQLSPTPVLHRPDALLALQRGHWQAANIQTFWAGEAFFDPEGDTQLLAYALAQQLVAELSRQGEAFRRFVRAAQAQDGGAAAARAELGLDLGAAVQALLGLTPAPGWSPLTAP